MTLSVILILAAFAIGFLVRPFADTADNGEIVERFGDWRARRRMLKAMMPLPPQDLPRSTVGKCPACRHTAHPDATCNIFDCGCGWTR